MACPWGVEKNMARALCLSRAKGNMGKRETSGVELLCKLPMVSASGISCKSLRSAHRKNAVIKNTCTMPPYTAHAGKWPKFPPFRLRWLQKNARPQAKNQARRIEIFCRAYSPSFHSLFTRATTSSTADCCCGGQTTIRGLPASTFFD